MPRPTLEPVESEAVEAVGYDAAAGELHVRFRGTPGTYVYEGVTPEEYGDLRAAASLGGHLNKEIKPRHPYRHLDGG